MPKVGRVFTNPQEADRIKARYVCSTCWQNLLIKHEEGGIRVECSNPNCAGGNFVTARFAEERRQASQAELLEARTTLRNIIPDKMIARLDAMTTEELLKGLV